MHQRRKLILWLSSIAFLVASLWLITAFFGASAIRRVQLQAMGLGSVRTDYADVSRFVDSVIPSKPPCYWCQANACLPLIVRVKYGAIIHEAGGGGEAYYFWCFGLSIRLRAVQQFGYGSTEQPKSSTNSISK
jgi:hypothetical protein